MKTATKLRIVVLVAGVAVVEALCRVGVIKPFIALTRCYFFIQDCRFKVA